MSTTNWPRTDSEISFTGAYTCTHHSDQMRAACPVCLVTTLTAERDQLRAALALGQQNCDDAYDDLRDERDAARAEVERLKTCGIVELAAINSSVLEYCKHWEARAMKAEADLVALEQCHDDNCRGVVKIAAELATERARLDYLLQWDVTFHDRADIDAELSYGQRKKSTPTLP